MKIAVDQQLCQSGGLCTGIAPEVFALSDDGVLILLDDSPEGGAAEDALFAVRSCPTRALTVVED